MRRAHPKNEILYHVPILPNFEGKSALKLCAEEKEFKNIDMVFRYLKLYGIDHHSRTVKELYPLLLAKKLPQFLEYLESRMI